VTACAACLIVRCATHDKGVIVERRRRSVGRMEFHRLNHPIVQYVASDLPMPGRRGGVVKSGPSKYRSAENLCGRNNQDKQGHLRQLVEALPLPRYVCDPELEFVALNFGWIRSFIAAIGGLLGYACQSNHLIGKQSK
jgi:hypothetical protein